MTCEKVFHLGVGNGNAVIDLAFDELLDLQLCTQFVAESLVSAWFLFALAAQVFQALAILLGDLGDCPLKAFVAHGKAELACHLLLQTLDHHAFHHLPAQDIVGRQIHFLGREAGAYRVHTHLHLAGGDNFIVNYNQNTVDGLPGLFGGRGCRVRHVDGQADQQYAEQGRELAV